MEHRAASFNRARVHAFNTFRIPCFIAVVRISKCQIAYKGFSTHVNLANPALNLELLGKATLKQMKIIMNRVYFYGEHEQQKFAYIVKMSKRHADQ